ncbi:MULTISPECIES: hypothetical protein [unclassified Burkholderia]|uniref:hypothetical protein n=1 Tax=unclassified Burkholderia TaxID=2613784 RepID=UPI001E2D4C95|nr:MULTISPECIES: hypothetical protein [unclassified Burkholderia]UEP31860.1 hypothetical protein LMA01_21995 [Burkholderia sp. B21-007]UEP45552.1 hypothetical protein LMA02_22785 [Burkholderia sp. B21-005]
MLHQSHLAEDLLTNRPGIAPWRCLASRNTSDVNLQDTSFQISAQSAQASRSRHARVVRHAEPGIIQIRESRITVDFSVQRARAVKPLPIAISQQVRQPPAVLCGSVGGVQRSPSDRCQRGVGPKCVERFTLLATTQNPSAAFVTCSKHRAFPQRVV